MLIVGQPTSAKTKAKEDVCLAATNLGAPVRIASYTQVIKSRPSSYAMITKPAAGLPVVLTLVTCLGGKLALVGADTYLVVSGGSP